MVVEPRIDPDSIYLGSGVRCEWGESGEHLLDIGAEVVAPNFHPRVADAGAVERPLVKMRVVVSEGVCKVAAVNVILIPAQQSYSLDQKLYLPIRVIAVSLFMVVIVTDLICFCRLLIFCFEPLVHLV